MGSPSLARGSAASGGKDQSMVNYTRPVSLKHYPRIQRQPELPLLTIADGHGEAARPQKARRIPLSESQPVLDRDRFWLDEAI